jgi:hypothetical protein
MRKYMVSVLGTQRNWTSRTDADRAAIMERYRAFAKRMAEEGRMVDGSELVGPTYGLSARQGRIAIDGPYPETKEVLGGYFILLAENDEQAMKLAEGIPALTYGDRLEVSALA